MDNACRSQNTEETIKTEDICKMAKNSKNDKSRIKRASSYAGRTKKLACILENLVKINSRVYTIIRQLRKRKQ